MAAATVKRIDKARCSVESTTNIICKKKLAGDLDGVVMNAGIHGRKISVDSVLYDFDKECARRYLGENLRSSLSSRGRKAVAKFTGENGGTRISMAFDSMEVNGNAWNDKIKNVMKSFENGLLDVQEECPQIVDR